MVLSKMCINSLKFLVASDVMSPCCLLDNVWKFMHPPKKIHKCLLAELMIWHTIRPPPKKLLYWRNPTDPKIRPDPTFFFNQKKRQKNDRPILKKAKPVFFFLILCDGAPWKNGNTFEPEVPNSEYVFKHLILALKMLILGFETWLVA